MIIDWVSPQNLFSKPQINRILIEPVAELAAPLAVAAIALSCDKYNAGEVASPGGYLRDMVEKAAVGELHLDRSFYGPLSENQAVR